MSNAALGRNYRVVITKDDDSGYVADIPTLKHCVAYGETIEEVMANMNEALDGVLEVLEAEGLPIPDDTNTIEYLISKPGPASPAPYQPEAA